jgi:molecular chaperone GrpE
MMKSQTKKTVPVHAEPEPEPSATPSPPLGASPPTESSTQSRLSAAPSVPADSSAPVTTDELDQLKRRAAKADDLYDQLLRKAADLENFKKRADREKLEAKKFANESLLQKLIPVLDNFDMALAAANTTDGTGVQSLQTGINMIYQQLKGILSEAGLEEVDATSKPFDPNLHEAVSQQETAEVPEGHVVQQLRKGYKLRDRLLRPASVVVAKEPAP